MKTNCLKCGYIRTPHDQAPDYECPKCGAIYEKVKAAIDAKNQKEKEERRKEYEEYQEEKGWDWSDTWPGLLLISGVCFWFSYDIVTMEECYEGFRALGSLIELVCKTTNKWIAGSLVFLLGVFALKHSYLHAIGKE